MSQSGRFIVIDKDCNVIYKTNYTSDLSDLECVGSYGMSIFDVANSKMSNDSTLIWDSDFHCGYCKYKYKSQLSISDIIEIEQCEIYKHISKDRDTIDLIFDYCDSYTENM